MKHRKIGHSKLIEPRLLACVIVFGVIGGVLLLSSHAATPTSAVEPDNATVSSAATKLTDSTASGSSAVKFGSGSTSSSGARGWAQIQNGTLVSDQGTLLRGGTLWFIPDASGQFNWATGTSSWAVDTKYHLNTVRLAMEYGPASICGEPLSLSQSESYLDAAIAQANSRHMYAVIDLHCTAGGHDQASAVTFWTAIADRYKNDTNVIYELLNEPVSWNPKDYSTQDIKDEQQLYTIARSEAPQTPIIMMSFAIPENDDDNPAPTMTDVTNKLTGVDWSNTAVGFHGYWVPNANGETQLKQHYAAINTEFQTPCVQSGLPEDVCEGDNYMEQTMERLGISWLCWDCNDLSSSSNLAAMQTAAQSGGWWWDADK